MRTESKTAFAQIWQLFGYDILDSHGTKVGLVKRVWTDNATGTLEFIGLKSGWLDGGTRVIPASDASIDGSTRSIRVAHSVETIGKAPRYNTDIPLTSDLARRVSTHYAKS
jgi:sporulation protein YlmC with PRC-barrel domain